MEQAGSLPIAQRKDQVPKQWSFSEREKALLQGSRAKRCGQCSDLSPQSAFEWGIYRDQVLSGLFNVDIGNEMGRGSKK